MTPMIVATGGAPSPLGPLSGAVGDAAARAAKDAARSALDAASQWVTDSFASVAGMVLREMQATTSVRLGDVFGGNSPMWRTALGLAAFLLLGAACAAVLQGVLRGEPTMMLRRVGVGLPAAVIAMAAVVPVTQILIQATDALSASVLEPALGPLQRLVGATTTMSGPGVGFLGLVLGSLAVTAAIGVWMELFARSALLFIVVGVSPIAFAAAVWPSMRHVAHRTVHFVVALLLAKPLIAMVFAIGALVVDKLGAQGDIEAKAANLITGLFIMVLAVFAPYALARVLPLAEAAVIAQGASRVPSALMGGMVAPFASTSGGGMQVQRLASAGGPNGLAGGGDAGTQTGAVSAGAGAGA
ncbi:MAG: hypothetical protein ACOYNI_12810, partial [Acidimicrobiia bacterium]